jgi:hypothetical protein
LHKAASKDEVSTTVSEAGTASLGTKAARLKVVEELTKRKRFRIGLPG